MIKFNVGDKVRETTPEYCIPGTVLEVIEENDVPFCSLVEGEVSPLGASIPAWREHERLAFLQDELELINE